MPRTFIQRLMLAILLSSGVAPLAVSQAHADEVKVPASAEDHFELAKVYQEKAAAYRKEVQFHREMLEAYKKRVPGPDKTGRPNPWAMKMQRHCQLLMKDAEKLAVDAEKAAEFHTLRGKELQGK